MGLFKPNIEKLSKKNDIEGITKALGHKDEEVRNQAAVALGELKDEKAIPSLIKTFLEDRYPVNESAVKALLQIRNKQGINEVIKALDNKSSNLRKLAAEALGENKVRAAIPTLTVLLTEDEDWTVRENAAEALKKIGWQPETVVERAFLYVIQGDFSSCIALGDKAIEPLIDALEDKHGQVGEASIRLEVTRAGLPSLSSSFGVKHVADVLGGQVQIMHALEKIGGAKATTAISKQKQSILPLIETEMSNKMILQSKYGDYWLILGALLSIAYFPSESREIVNFINKILTASCQNCGAKIPKGKLSALTVASDFAMGIGVNPICDRCGWPQMLIRLKL